MVTISKSQIISQKSKAELERLLPLSHFALRPLNPDIHIDYFVELVEKNDPSGVHFGIQLKGVQKLSYNKSQIKFPMKTKHLSYYLDKVKTYPVFLIVVDIESNRSYWLFLQKYLNDEIPNKQWRKQKIVNVLISDENLINDVEVLKKKVQIANNYMIELWPSPLYLSASKEKKYLESLDNRFKVQSINIFDKRIHYDIKSTENCNLNFIFKGGNNIDDFLLDPDREKIQFNSQDIEVEGSELFKELLKKPGNFELKYAKPTFAVDVFLSRLNASQIEVERLHITGQIIVNNGSFEIDSQLKDSPLRIKVVVAKNPDIKPTFDFNFEFTNWHNKPIHFLPYANKLNAIFSNHIETDQLFYKVELAGEPFIGGTIDLWKQKDFVEYLNSVFSLYRDIKLINAHYNLNLNFPDLNKLQKADTQDIEELATLLDKKEYQVLGKSLTLRLKIKNDKKLFDPFQINSDIRLVTDIEFKILGKKVVIDRMAIDINNPKILINREEFENLLQSKEELIPLSFKADKDSKVFYRLIEEEIKL